MSPGEFRLRIGYAKDGRLRWLSHLEVLRALERMVRRSGLPFAVTQGFHPHMKIAFGPALPVGTAGLREYADLWMTRYAPTEAAVSALRSAAPPELAPFSGVYVGDREASLACALTIAQYRVEVEGEGLGPAQARAGFARLFESGTLELTHRGKTKVFDLARSVPKDARIEEGATGLTIEFPVRMGEQGSLRPEAFVRAALNEIGVSPSAVRTTRLDLLVEDDEGVWSRPM